MKSYTNRTAIAVLAVALSLPPIAVASPRRPDQDRSEVSPIIYVIRKIHKLFGISTHDDLPQPPLPAPPPPPTNP